MNQLPGAANQSFFSNMQPDQMPTNQFGPTQGPASQGSGGYGGGFGGDLSGLGDSASGAMSKIGLPAWLIKMLLGLMNQKNNNNPNSDPRTSNGFDQNRIPFSYSPSSPMTVPASMDNPVATPTGSYFGPPQQ